MLLPITLLACNPSGRTNSIWPGLFHRWCPVKAEYRDGLDMLTTRGGHDLGKRRIALAVLALVMWFGITASGSVRCSAAEDIKISRIDVQGNKAVSTETILGIIATKQGDVISGDKLETHIREKALKDLDESGFFADYRASFSGKSNEMVIILEVVENPVCTDITFSGNTLASSQQLEALLGTRVGKIINTRTLQNDLDELVKHYAHKGNVVRIRDVSLDPKGLLTIGLSEAKVGSITVLGNKKTKTEVVLRELESKVGDYLDLDSIREDQRRLINLGFFETVTPKFSYHSEVDDVDYTIELVERQKMGIASGGLGYSGKDGLLGYLDISEDNLFGKGQRLRLRLEAGTKGTKTFEFGFREPWLDKNKTSLDFNLYSRQTLRTDSLHQGDEQLTSYTESRTGGDISFGRPLDRDTTLSLRLKNETTTSSGSDNKPLGLVGDGVTRSVTAGITRDTRDNFANPKSGTYMTLSAEAAGGALGGDNEFARLETTGSTYLKGFKDHTLALRMTGGRVIHNGTLPLQEKYRIGGSESVRGYDYGDMQGDSMMSANLEYRFPIAKILSGVLFADAGDAWMAADGSKGLKLGAGLGLRFETPLGLLRLDYGMAKNPGGELGGKTYFSIGQLF